MSGPSDVCRRAREAGLVCLDFEGGEPLAVFEDGRRRSAERLGARWSAALSRATLAERDGATRHELAVCSAAKRLTEIIARPSTEWDAAGFTVAYRSLVDALAPLDARGIIPAGDSWIGGATC